MSVLNSVGLVPSCLCDFIGPNFFSRGYFVNLKFVFVGISNKIYSIKNITLHKK